MSYSRLQRTTDALRMKAKSSYGEKHPAFNLIVFFFSDKKKKNQALHWCKYLKGVFQARKKMFCRLVNCWEKLPASFVNVSRSIFREKDIPTIRQCTNSNRQRKKIHLELFWLVGCMLLKHHKLEFRAVVTRRLFIVASRMVRKELIGGVRIWSPWPSFSRSVVRNFKLGWHD